MRTQRDALLAALVLAFMPISSSVTSPGPHSPLWARPRGTAVPALLLLHPPLDIVRNNCARAGLPWGHLSAGAWEARRDDGWERPSGAERELLACMRWAAVGRMRAGGGGEDWRGPPGDAWGRSGGYHQWQGPVQGGAVGGGRGGGSGNGRGGGGRGGDGRQAGWRGGGGQGRGRGAELRRSARGRGRQGTAANLSATPPWRQPRGKTIVSLVNSHANATSKSQHLWEIDFRFAPGLPPWWYRGAECPAALATIPKAAAPFLPGPVLLVPIARTRTLLAFREGLSNGTGVPRS